MIRAAWDDWPCTRACTAFFKIPMAAVIDHVPAPLDIFVDREGRGEIELGYVRTRTGTHGLPACDELAWAIRVRRVSGSGFAFYAMNLAADDASFLQHQSAIGFETHDELASFRPREGGADLHISAAGAPICVMRDRSTGRVPLPTLPGDTEVWTHGPGGRLERRLFVWRGLANVLPTPTAAWNLFPHPFFRGVDVSRADPLPYQVLASTRIVDRASQRFTKPRPYP